MKLKMMNRPGVCRAVGFAVMVCVLLVSGGNAQAGSFVTFQWGKHDTRANAIDSAGTVTGDYSAGSRGGGFVRQANGQITIFGPVSVEPVAIDPSGTGTVTGYYYDTTGVSFGFVRQANGVFKAFSVGPGITDVYPIGINSAGTITGSVMNARNRNAPEHGFVRAIGVNTRIDPPGSTNTEVSGIDSAGTVAGSYNFGTHGFVRNASGVFTTFDLPGASRTTVTAIEPSGTGMVTGSYFDATGSHAFIRNADGAFTTFDGLTPGQDIEPAGINSAGTVAGVYFDAVGALSHGFVRTANGTITTVDPPGSVGTSVSGINSAGTVVGIYAVPNSATPGRNTIISFLFVP